MRKWTWVTAVCLTLIGVAFCFQNCGYMAPSETHSVLSLSSVSDYASLKSAVISQKCLACHNSVKSEGGYDMSSYTAIMSGGRVIPSDANNSLLVQRVQDGTMPPSAPLSDAEISAFEYWVNEGAPE